MGELCSIGDGNYSSKYPKASEFQNNGIPFLTPTNIKNGTVISTDLKFISKEQHASLKKGHVKKDDLVVVVRGFTTGNNSLVPEEYSNSNLNSQLAFLRTKSSDIESKFLFFAFNDPSVQRVIKKTISGTNQLQLPNNKLLGIKIGYPKLKEQQIIVSQLEDLRAETQKLESIYQQKIKDLDELKKSILQKAFTGELTTEKAVAV